MKLFTHLIRLNKSSKSAKIAENLLVMLFWLAVWQILYILIGKEILFVSPFGVVRAFLSLGAQSVFWKSIALSLGRMLFGYFLALFVGVITAWLCLKSRLFNLLFCPLMNTIKATPVASFSILVLLWVQTGFVPVVISFLMVMPLIWANTRQGFRNINSEYIEMTLAYNFTKAQKIRLLYLPSLSPYLLAACQTGIGMAWKSAIAAEIICTPALGIGKSLYETKIYLDSPALFAWTAVIILCSLIIEKIFVRIISSRINTVGIAHTHHF